MCGNARGEYTNCGGDAIVQYGNAFYMLFSWTVRVTPVWWWQNVQFLEVMVVMKLTPSELAQYMIPPLELVQGRLQQLFIVDPIMT